MSTFIDALSDPEPEEEPREGDLADLKEVFEEFEGILKNQWHDPRYGLRLAAGFIQLLQTSTVDEILEMDLLRIQPVERL